MCYYSQEYTWIKFILNFIKSVSIESLCKNHRTSLVLLLNALTHRLSSVPQDRMSHDFLPAQGRDTNCNVWFLGRADLRRAWHSQGLRTAHQHHLALWEVPAFILVVLMTFYNPVYYVFILQVSELLISDWCLLHPSRRIRTVVCRTPPCGFLPLQSRNLLSFRSIAFLHGFK